MKVVLFCGGMGLRLREFSESAPKPMAPLGDRPILWHLMKYYAHYGHRDFILCLGWQGRMIKEYFLNYDECLSNDFVLSQGGASVKLIASDIHDWSITFVDTGVSTCIGQRLAAAAPHLEGEETFLANYSDGLTDLPLPTLIEYHQRQQAVATFLAVRPKQSFHAAKIDDAGKVADMTPIDRSDVWMNGGFFVLDKTIFDYLGPGEELVIEPFHRLIGEGRLAAYKYDGYWGCMDTYKEKQQLDEMIARGETPWQVWKRPTPASPSPPLAPRDAVAPLRRRAR
jgi:glucose-1-phosphate cytidylyltransferase